MSCAAPPPIFVAQPNSSRKWKFYQPAEYFSPQFRRSQKSNQLFQTRSDHADDMLKYWSDQASCNNMPILCQLAELYLGMAPSSRTSVPVECLFSSAALIANGKRSSSKPYKSSLLTVLSIIETVEHYLETAKLNSRSLFS